MRPRGFGTLAPTGYIYIKINGKRFFEHRLIMEKHIGRKLCRRETVHHRDGNRSNNKISNLQLKINAHSPGQTLKDLIEIVIKSGCKVEIPPELQAVL